MRMRVSFPLVLFVMASCPRGTWSETAGLANGTPAKAVHDTAPSNVDGANKKNRNVHTTSGPVGPDACIQPTEANAGHKDQASGSLDPDEVLAIDALVLPGLPQ